MDLFRSHLTIILPCCAISVLTVVSCVTRNSIPDPQQSSASNSQECAEWTKAQVTRRGLEWDLLYESLLQSNGFGSDSVIWKWIHKDGPRPQVNEAVARWQGEPVVSSILIEGAGPEGSPGGSWYIRTTTHLYRWNFNKGVFERQKEEFTTLQEYDKAFESMACWQQAVPVRTDTFLEGYWGFLSLYKEGRSRQMLLTFRDLCLVDPEIVNREGDRITNNENNWGRLWKTLKPVLHAGSH